MGWVGTGVKAQFQALSFGPGQLARTAICFSFMAAAQPTKDVFGLLGGIVVVFQ